MLQLSSSFVADDKPLSSATLPGQVYVLAVASLQSCYAAAASAPTNDIHIFDKTDLKRSIAVLKGDQGAITALRSAHVIGSAQSVLLSCGKDRVIRAWDERTGAAAIEMSSSKGGALLCCDSSLDGFTVAGGTELQGEDAHILYWDPRNPAAPLRVHSSTHSDDITCLEFSSSGPQTVLLSASSDGLISISDPMENDEDEAGLQVGNWGCSISKAGWISGSQVGQDTVALWASSDMETFSSWSGQLDLVEDLDREVFTKPDQQMTWVTDYIANCHSSRSGSFYYFAGSNEGDIALIRSSDVSSKGSPWEINRVYSTGHRDVVRCTIWDEANNVLITGGEDSLINAWRCPSSSASPDDMDVDVPIQRKRLHQDDHDDGARKYRMPR